MKNNDFHTAWPRLLLVAAGIVAGTFTAHAQFDGIGIRAGMNATRPASENPFLLRTGWNSTVFASWKIGPLSAVSAGISLNRLHFTETFKLNWPSDFGGDGTTYENTGSITDVGCTVLWRRGISQRLHRLSPTLGFTASKVYGTVRTLRVSGTGDLITFDEYRFPRYNLSALLGFQWDAAVWERGSISILPMYAYALARVKSTDPVEITSTYRPNFFSVQLGYTYKIK